MEAPRVQYGKSRGRTDLFLHANSLPQPRPACKARPPNNKPTILRFMHVVLSCVGLLAPLVEKLDFNLLLLFFLFHVPRHKTPETSLTSYHLADLMPFLAACAPLPCIHGT